MPSQAAAGARRPLGPAQLGCRQLLVFGPGASRKGQSAGWGGESWSEAELPHGACPHAPVQPALPWPGASEPQKEGRLAVCAHFPLCSLKPISAAELPVGAARPPCPLSPPPTLPECPMPGPPHPPALGTDAASAAGGLFRGPGWAPRASFLLGSPGPRPSCSSCPGSLRALRGPGPTQPWHWHLQQPRDQGPRVGPLGGTGGLARACLTGLAAPGVPAAGDSTGGDQRRSGARGREGSGWGSRAG